MNSYFDDTETFTLVDLLRHRVQRHSDKLAFTFLLNGESEKANLTYKELDQKARAIGAELQRVQATNERVLLLYPPGEEFIAAFFGCLYAGAVAVPAYPPRPNKSLSRLQAIAADAQAAVALTTTSVLSNLDGQLTQLNNLQTLQWIATDNINSDNENLWKEPKIDRDTLAFIQYTSGSTATPKGVMVTHSNLLHNEQMIQKAFGHTANTIFVGWLPLYHDMGLIGNILQPVYLGIHCILMSPVDFIRKPDRWLRAISKYRATTSGGPNFAYDLCVKKIQSEQLTNIDLSSWEIAFNGAEPIRAETLQNFAEKFTCCGFNYSAFYPCYGMAETTLFTTGGDKNKKPRLKAVKVRELEQNFVVESEILSPESRVFVGCGYSYMNTTVIIVNPESLTRCTKNQVGEIWVSSESIASGYWNLSSVTQQTFKAYLKDTGDGPFLRTGDLGFISDGELFVTGRLKDVIIIRGRNHYPQDIELSVQKSHIALRDNCGAAFSVTLEQEEKLVVVQEVERTYVRQLKSGEVVEAINQAVSLEHELAVDIIVLLKPGNIPKTSSGKIKRSVCRQKFLDGSLQNIVFSKSLHSLETQFEEIEFSLLYFSSNSSEFTSNKYQLLIEGAKFADQNNFRAVWIPERHFHPFGGLYPEPATLGSALAMVTQNIRIRPGSIVLPLQNPVRVAEQWSVVDNLSEGRVDISFAKGWNPNDFVLSPSTYANRTQVMFDRIKTVKKLWRGESISLVNGVNKETDINIYPSPKQLELNVWITCSGGKEMFVEAGAIGANILTALLFQPMEELASKIALYRESRAKNGYNPNSGHVTLMLHTFVGSDLKYVRNKVREPFIGYLQSSIDLWRNNSQSLDKLTESEREKLLTYAFERYFQTTALFGTPSSCLKMVNQLKKIGVDEIACLIDFGVDVDSVLSNLNYLNQLRQKADDIRYNKTSQKVEKLAINSIDQKQLEVQVKTEEQDIVAMLNNELPENTDKNPVINENQCTNESDIQANNDLTIRSLQKIIIQNISDSLNINPDSVDLNKSFFGLGVDSLKALELIENLSENLNISVPPTLLFEYPTIAQLSEYLMKLNQKRFSKEFINKE